MAFVSDELLIPTFLYSDRFAVVAVLFGFALETPLSTYHLLSPGTGPSRLKEKSASISSDQYADILLTSSCVLFFAAVYLCYKNYAYYRANPVSLHQTTNLKGYAESLLTKQETWMVLLVVVAIVLVILLLVVIFLRKRITIAIALIREGSK